MTWRTVKLGEISVMKYGKLTPKDTADNGSFPVFTGYRIAGYCNEFLYDEPEVVVVARGVGGTGDVKMSPEKSWITNLSIVLKVDSERVDKWFLFYRLGQEPLKDKLNTGAAQAQITIENLQPYVITVPCIAVQRRIASILSAYDDAIENNRRRMALLEKAARLLYEEWFVRLRFPGQARTRITDGVPKGWQLLELDKLAGIVMGQSPESKFYNETGNGLPFHQGVADFGDRFVSNRIFTSEQTRIAEANSILCSVRAPVGRLNVTLEKIAIGRGLAALNSRTGHQSLLMYQLRNHFFKEDLIGSGSIFASVAKKELFGQKLLTPPQQLADKFEALSLPIDNQLRVLYLQNQKLRAARDLLLPRLMSGEIEVVD